MFNRIINASSICKVTTYPFYIIQSEPSVYSVHCIVSNEVREATWAWEKLGSKSERWFAQDIKRCKDEATGLAPQPPSSGVK